MGTFIILLKDFKVITFFDLENLKEVNYKEFEGVKDYNFYKRRWEEVNFKKVKHVKDYYFDKYRKITCIACTPSSDYIAYGDDKGIIHIVSIEKKKKSILFVHIKSAYNL